MPVRIPCPACKAPGSHWLESGSRVAHFDYFYFRCTKCGHVRNIRKNGKGEPHDVTERRKPA
jgi:predicted  nucleic acid-binding Zn ribbon protein